MLRHFNGAVQPDQYSVEGHGARKGRVINREKLIFNQQTDSAIRDTEFRY
jgi:hypothetical protein